MNSERTDFTKWWILIALLLFATVIVGFGLRMVGVIGERVVFQNSYQKHSADNAKVRMLRSELAGIEARLSNGGLNEAQRSDLIQQKVGIEYQLNITE